MKNKNIFICLFLFWFYHICSFSIILYCKEYLLHNGPRILIYGELILEEVGSSDKIFEEINKLAQENPNKNIKVLFSGPGGFDFTEEYNNINNIDEIVNKLKLFSFINKKENVVYNKYMHPQFKHVRFSGVNKDIQISNFLSINSLLKIKMMKSIYGERVYFKSIDPRRCAIFFDQNAKKIASLDFLLDYPGYNNPLQSDQENKLELFNKVKKIYEDNRNEKFLDHALKEYNVGHSIELNNENYEFGKLMMPAVDLELLRNVLEANENEILVVVAGFLHTEKLIENIELYWNKF